MQWDGPILPTSSHEDCKLTLTSIPTTISLPAPAREIVKARYVLLQSVSQMGFTYITDLANETKAGDLAPPWRHKQENQSHGSWSHHERQAKGITEIRLDGHRQPEDQWLHWLTCFSLHEKIQRLFPTGDVSETFQLTHQHYYFLREL